MEDKREKYKHKYEKIIFVLDYIISFLIFVFFVFLGYKSIKNVHDERDMLARIIEDDLNIIDIIVHIGGFIAIILLIITLIRIFVAIYKDKIKAEADDIHVSENQFKELLDAEKEFAERLGIKKLPKIYICSNYDKDIEVRGVTFDSINWVRINYEEVFNKYELKCDVAKFTLAKKLAYIYMGYYSRVYFVLTIFTNWVPIVNNLVNRVMEYTTDKIAMDLVGKDEAIRSIIALKAGFYIMSLLNVDAYIENIENVKKNKSVFLINMLRSIPIPPYRLDALINNKDGKLF